MYKSTIKGKKLFDLVDLFVRRKLYDSLQKIMYQNKMRNAVEAFEVRISNFKKMLMRDALDSLIFGGMDKCCSSLEKVLNKISFRVKC